MDIESIAPELREAYARMPKLDMTSARNRRTGRVLGRLMRPRRTPGVRIRNRRMHGVRVRTYEPAEVRSPAALLWIHGGGMIIGSPNLDDPLMTAVATELGIRCYSVDYRLAPENPFPIPLDDCEDTWRSLRKEAGVDPDRVAIGGGSAGGGLAASLVQRVHDEGGHQPVAQWLFEPMLDDRTAARRELDAGAHLGWDNRHNRYGWSALLQAEPGSPDLPAYAVPARRLDLRGLPPAWIGVGDIDLFHDEDVEYARRLREAGVDVTLDIVAGAPHGFEVIARTASLGVEYQARARRWLAGALGTAAAPNGG